MGQFIYLVIYRLLEILINKIGKEKFAFLKRKNHYPYKFKTKIMHIFGIPSHSGIEGNRHLRFAERFKIPVHAHKENV